MSPAVAPASYRKKPVLVRAAQWYPGREVEGVVTRWDEVPAGNDIVRDAVKHNGGKLAAVQTQHGWAMVAPGDWVVTGVNGERYPCAPDVFAQTYELDLGQSLRVSNITTRDRVEREIQALKKAKLGLTPYQEQRILKAAGAVA